jgi:hypothetical protein
MLESALKRREHSVPLFMGHPLYYYLLFNQDKNNIFKEIYKMLMDSLDKSQTKLQDQTIKRKNIVKSKCFKISIGLCIMLILAVATSFIIKALIKSKNELRNEERIQKTPNQHKYSKYKYKYLRSI